MSNHDALEFSFLVEVLLPVTLDTFVLKDIEEKLDESLESGWLKWFSFFFATRNTPFHTHETQTAFHDNSLGVILQSTNNVVKSIVLDAMILVMGWNLDKQLSQYGST